MDESRGMLDSISVLGGVGPNRVRQFEKLGIETVEDLLYYVPRDYIDYSNIVKISDLKPGIVSVEAQLVAPPSNYKKGGRSIVHAEFEDETGRVKAVWFNQPWLAKQLVDGEEYILSGKFDFFGRGYSFSQPEIELLTSKRLNTGAVVAKYSQTVGLSSKMIRSLQKKALTQIKIEEPYPDAFIKNQNLLPLSQAFELVHFPIDSEQTVNGRMRLEFDELFGLMMVNRLQKDELQLLSANKVDLDIEYVKEFLDTLDFKLTDAQRVATWQIIKQINSTSAMNRMLEGDVGSGKTVVAAIAMLLVSKSGYQSLLLAPTTVLAAQHFQTVKNLLGHLELKVDILTRHLSKSQKEELKTKLVEGKIDILISTHAVLSDQMRFKNLALTVIDEQHRFGVEQRAKLVSKNSSKTPHVLTMTATPIPRSLALTLYGELDVSIIDELPKGRKKIDTKVYNWKARSAAYNKVIEAAEKGEQTFVVAPRIEDSDDLMANVESLYEELSKGMLKKLKIGVMHGKMKEVERERAINSFIDKKIDVLLSTTIVEVGVDIPNATIMIVESADRFGLAQLHQLRGRVGRSDKKSQCLLISSKGLATTNRLNAMTTTSDGFKLSELDLKLRGPGALYGVRQHGALDLNLADITNTKFVAMVKGAVDQFIKDGYNVVDFPILKRRVAAFKTATFLN